MISIRNLSLSPSATALSRSCPRYAPTPATADLRLYLDQRPEPNDDYQASYIAIKSPNVS